MTADDRWCRTGPIVGGGTMPRSPEGRDRLTAPGEERAEPQTSRMSGHRTSEAPRERDGPGASPGERAPLGCVWGTLLFLFDWQAPERISRQIIKGRLWAACCVLQQG
jgi:hypothetical protein